MFARKNTFRNSVVNITAGLLSSLLCVAFVYAQQDPKDDSTNSQHIERFGESTTDEWEMDLSLPTAAPAASANAAQASLPDAAQDQQLQQLLSNLAADPGSTKALSQMRALLGDILKQANVLLDAGSPAEATRLLAVVQSIDPATRGLTAAQNRLKISGEVETLVTRGNAAINAQRYVEPPNGNALYYFQSALAKDPRSELVQAGLQRVQEALVDLASESAQGLDFETANQWLDEAAAIREDQSLVDDARNQLLAFANMRGDDLGSGVMTAIAENDFNVAELGIIELIALGGQETRIQRLQAKLEEARYYGGFEPGQVISDAFLTSDHRAPGFVVVSAGSFRMGSNKGNDNEKPRHRVTIERGFGFGVNEVTVAEFQLFIERSGYQTAAEQAGRSTIYDEQAGRLNSRTGVNWRYAYDGELATPDMPVLHVNWNDAQAYVLWLSEQTGKNYRLPTEAEYEYVARGAGTGTYWWGEGSPSRPVENLTGDGDTSPSNRGWTTSFSRYGDESWGPSDAGSLQSDLLIHSMGVNDIAGNVSEWVEDCWHPNYMQAPSNGTAWVNPGCARRIARGGYWASSPDQSRAAFRISAKPETTGPVVGIRIARDL